MAMTENVGTVWDCHRRFFSAVKPPSASSRSSDGDPGSGVPATPSSEIRRMVPAFRSIERGSAACDHNVWFCFWRTF